MTRQRLLRAVREMRPYMLIAAGVCFAIAAVIGGPLHLIGTSLPGYDRVLLAVGWCGYGALLFTIAYLTGEPR